MSIFYFGQMRMFTVIAIAVTAYEHNKKGREKIDETGKTGISLLDTQIH